MPDDPLKLAIGALGQRERSSAELGEWLRKRGVGKEDVAATLEELASIGELDDARFARRFAEDKRELSGWGAERILEALLARGIGIADAETAASSGAEEELERAVDLLGRRGRTLGSDRDRASALAYLTRRGFPYELAYDAIHACERRAA